jgi:hypothetical protein
MPIESGALTRYNPSFGPNLTSASHVRWSLPFISGTADIPFRLAGTVAAVAKKRQ